MPHRDRRRITIVTANPARPDRDWDVSRGAAARLIVIDTFDVAAYAVSHGLADMDLDVERVIFDRAATAEQYLQLLASLPHNFVGDLMYIRDDGSAFLSALGRGGDRVLYSLAEHDVRFYLEAHSLVTGQTMIGAMQIAEAAGETFAAA